MPHPEPIPEPISGRRLRSRIDALAAVSDEADALTRLFLSPAHRRAIDLVGGWMEEAGMRTRLDEAGTLVGRYEGVRPDLPALLLGSHIDTVRDGGRFDGAFGVVAGIAAVAVLAAEGRRLPFAIEVLAFGDEEGVRFPTTLAGSRAIAGLFDPAALDGPDADGVSLREALLAFGCDPGRIGTAARRREDVLGYVEIHIEQATILQDRGQPVGLVQGISGAARLAIEIAGTSGHAGTLPMAGRADALCGAAEIVLAIERRAKATPGLFATVGRIEARPGAVNVVPGGASFTLDIRGLDDEVRRGALDAILDEGRSIAAARGLGFGFAVSYDENTTRCDPTLMRGLAQAMALRQLAPIEMASGAGHDGLAVAKLCPIAMLFVRCRDGVSHHPAEEVSDADMETAAAVLLDFLRNAALGLPGAVRREDVAG